MSTANNRARLPGRARREELLRLLGEQDGMLHTRKEALRYGVPAGRFAVIDDEEHSFDAEERGVGLSVLEITSHTVQGIETALRHVQAGDYGICSDCRSRIASERLKAVPFAERCHGCQEKTDMGGWVKHQPRNTQH
jgi:RNA polymerase-binding transcription factor DksA